jgi:hypothetical protein
MILFLNHKIKNCGVYQYGLRLFEILQKDTNNIYVYKEIDSYEEYKNITNESLTHIIYNYHHSTMNWLNKDTIQKENNVINIGIPHESPDNLFDIVCNIDPNAPERIHEKIKYYSLPRPIYESFEIKTNAFIDLHQNSGLPIFGSFGFGFQNKGFHKMVKMINQQYDNAIIKLVIPIAHFDPDPYTVDRMRQMCIQQNIKPGIILLITHDFFSTNEILTFLQTNTMNIFLYDQMHGRGISSAIDYAISVKKPIGISDSYMFRNIYSDDLCLYKHSIDYCLKQTISKCLKDYSHENMINKMNTILN